MNNPLSVPASPPTLLWLELVEEAQRYVKLVLTLTEADLPLEEREKLEEELLQSLSHLAVHSKVLDESVLEALELADQDEPN
jgi:hypothetical protein